MVIMGINILITLIWNVTEMGHSTYCISKELFCRSRAFVQSLWHPYICMWLLPTQNCNSAMLRDWERRSCRSNPLTVSVFVEMSWCSDLFCARIINFFVMICDVVFFLNHPGPTSDSCFVFLKSSQHLMVKSMSLGQKKITISAGAGTSGRGWVIELHMGSFLKIRDPQVAPRQANIVFFLFNTRLLYTLKIDVDDLGVSWLRNLRVTYLLFCSTRWSIECKKHSFELWFMIPATNQLSVCFLPIQLLTYIVT